MPKMWSSTCKKKNTSKKPMKHCIRVKNHKQVSGFKTPKIASLSSISKDLQDSRWPSLERELDLSDNNLENDILVMF